MYRIECMSITIYNISCNTSGAPVSPRHHSSAAPTRITMHEYSITESMLSLALEKATEAGASKITRIDIVLGEMSGIVGECVQMYFDLLSRDTIAAGAGLEIKTVPVSMRCHHCGKVFTPAAGDLSCPDCRQTGIEIVAGRECHMESIEVE